MDEPRAYYTEWSESERERQISYINAYIWNLERWCWRAYMQGSNGDSGRRNRVAGTGRDMGQTRRVALKHALPYGKLDSQWRPIVWLRELKSRALWQPRRLGLRERWEEGWRAREEIYVYLQLIHADIWQKPTQYCKAIVLSHFSHFRFFVTPWTAECQAPLSMGFPRQEYWSGVPFPSPGDLPDPGIEPGSAALQADSLPSDPLGKPTVKQLSSN